jgi:signal transduction histidine kinase/CheY-like chemotaxis protein/HPt (histidine-containing phosphotransfer) domain-containing protein
LEHETVEQSRPLKYRSISSRFSIFTGVLLLWVVGVTIWWDIRQHTFDWTKGVILCGIVAMIAAAISRFTIRLLARPLALLEAGITSVRKGQLKPIQVSRTGDEIEYLGESFNRMIEALAGSQEEIRLHQELLEDRIHQRTEELERAMHGALNASQAKSEFLTNMSHELRTPMNGLLGMLDLALDGGVSGEQKDQLETAQRCAYSLLALLNDILDLSKIEAGKMMLEKIPFDARSVVEDCVKSQAAKASQKRIDLRFEADRGPQPTLMGDPLRVRQIVANLLSNAIKFTDHGKVLVKLELTPSVDNHVNAILLVTDTGPGIPSDKLATIFEKFTQADGSITRKYGGTGLGLAITRRLVEIHGGEVNVESQLGKGSTFRVSLPCEIAPAPLSNAQPAQKEIRGETLRPSPTARLLLVEDNLVNQKVVLAILRKKGYHIDVANDGSEALAKLAASTHEAPYDLVLMDVQMPVLDGLEATRLIRMEARWDHLPIVAMTAHAMNGDRERCLQSGMNAYISKPVQPAHLIATIERQLASGDRHSAITSSPLERVLTDRMMEDSVMMNDMLRLFLQIAPERLDRIEAAATRADAATLQREVRKISIAADQLASISLRECAHRVQLTAAGGDFAQVKRDLLALREVVSTLETLTTGQPANS